MVEILVDNNTLFMQGFMYNASLVKELKFIRNDVNNYVIDIIILIHVFTLR